MRLSFHCSRRCVIILSSILTVLLAAGITLMWLISWDLSNLQALRNFVPWVGDVADSIPTVDEVGGMQDGTVQEESNEVAAHKRTFAPLTESRLVKTELLMQGSTTVTRRVLIYLPVGYSAAGGQRYPTVYLLHGSPGQETDWIGMGAKEDFDTAIAAGHLPPSIVVFPDGNGGMTRDTQFLDAADGSELNETFITQTVVQYIDAQYPTWTVPRYRAIGGLSSGGFGALNLGLKHQNVFGEIISLSGYGYVDKNIFSNKLIQNSKSVIQDNSPLLYLDRLTQATAHVLLIVGKQDPYLKENKKMQTLFIKRGIATDLMDFDGSHSWAFWGKHLGDGLVWLGGEWMNFAGAK